MPNSIIQGVRIYCRILKMRSGKKSRGLLLRLWPHSYTRGGFSLKATIVFLSAWLALLNACAHLPNLTEGFDPGAYQPITFQDLKQPEQAGLKSGEKIKVAAFFWQFVTYDPAILSNYPNFLRYPFTWYRLEWAALYGSADMKDYYDRVVMEAEQRERYPLKRLDHIMVYGELASLAPGKLYLRLHHLDRIEDD